MRILFLSQLLPYPADAGAKVRAYYTLRWLAQQHAVTLVAFTRPGDSPDAVTHLQQYCQAVHTIPIRRSRWRDGLAFTISLLRGQSFIIRRDQVAEMDALIHMVLNQEQFDAIHSDQLWMAQYALRARQQAPGIRLVLDEHNACFQIFARLAEGESNLIKRLVWKREARYLERYEARVCSRFDRVVTVTREDGEILSDLVQDRPSARPVFSTIPICVDTDEVPAVKPELHKLSVLSLGTMFWPPNVEGVRWFLEQVWPLVQEVIPDVAFSIVGKDPPAELQGMAKGKGVEFTGYVPDLLPWLEKAGVFVVPLLSGSGMRVKIIDAWRWGLPVVSTTIGAEGIQYSDGENILIADSAQAFARLVVQVLSDDRLACALRENGRRWVEQHYDWRSVYSAWDAVYG